METTEDLMTKTIKTIDTLVEDIYELIQGEDVFSLPDELTDMFSERMKTLVQTRLNRQETVDDQNRALRISAVGKPCERQNWYGIHRPDTAEPLRPETRIKFLYGDVIEELLLFLAEAAGHRVEGQQDRMEVAGVPGHRDAVIDGTLVDVKSASTYSFKKFAAGELQGNDSFGYIGQIQTYLEACQDDPIVTDKNRCAFLVMDKTLGHLCLDVHERMHHVDIPELTKRKKEVAENPDVIPDRAFKGVADGASGNEKLCVECSYCPFKKECWPNLRTFLYSNGPRHLITVKKVPNVPEA